MVKSSMLKNKKNVPSLFITLETRPELENPNTTCSCSYLSTAKSAFQMH